MKFEKRTEKLKVEHESLVQQREVYSTSIDNFKQKRTIIDGEKYKVYPSIYPGDEHTTHTNRAKLK